MHQNTFHFDIAVDLVAPQSTATGKNLYSQIERASASQERFSKYPNTFPILPYKISYTKYNLFNIYNNINTLEIVFNYQQFLNSWNYFYEVL